MSDRKGCLKRGCLGCAALLGLVILGLIVMAVLGVATRGGESRIENIEREQPVPIVELPPQVESGEDQSAELPRIPENFPIERPGRIELGLRYGEFEVVPGPPGSPVSVVGDFDAGRFKLIQSYTELDDGSWIYKIEFDRKGVGFLIQDEMENRVTVTIPRQAPIEIVGELGLGETNLELGGLWLLGLDLKIGIGEHRIGFSEPTLVPIPRVTLESSVGVLEVRRLGNASPRDVEITHTIGETEIDLEGQWLNDADVEIRCGIGECHVDTPRHAGVVYRNVGIMIGDSRHAPEREAEAGEPTLTLSVSATIGELSIR